MRSVKYPFVPKSTAYLEPGQFWSIPLSSGQFACGTVLELDETRGQRDSRQLLAGLLDWSGPTLPTAASLAGVGLLAHGQAHVKTIRKCGGTILGVRDPQEAGIGIPLTLDQALGRGCRVRRGFTLLGLASWEQQVDLPVFTTWGYRVILLRAEKQFGGEERAGSSRSAAREGQLVSGGLEVGDVYSAV